MQPDTETAFESPPTDSDISSNSDTDDSFAGVFEFKTFIPIADKPHGQEMATRSQNQFKNTLTVAAAAVESTDEMSSNVPDAT